MAIVVLPANLMAIRCWSTVVLELSGHLHPQSEVDGNTEATSSSLNAWHFVFQLSTHCRDKEQC